MKKSVFDRYERASDGSILIDIAADKVEDLFSDYDRSAPYIKRDLNTDLVDYLINCAQELGREPFSICFTLSTTPDDARVARIRRSIDNYFMYLIAIEKHKVRQMVNRSAILFCIGIAVLFISVWAHGRLRSDPTVAATVLAEGLTVAAWVSLWEALATFLLGWLPHHGDINLYRRLASANPVFRSRPEEKPPLLS